MAESVARVKILAQIEGLEGFDKLKGAFKGLQQAIGPADADLSKARKEILEFGKAGAKTEQVIRGQVDALKALQGQASISGSVYRKLSQDIKALDNTYKEATKSAAEFRAEQAKVRNQIPAAKERTLANQLAPFKAELQEASVYARRYGELLAEIERQQKPFDRAVARQRVIGSAEALRMGPLQAQQALPALPDTTAGLNQRLSELNADFVNLARGGDRWIQVSREIANVQRQLNQEFANPAVEAARRRLEASRNTSSGFLAFSSGLEDRLAVQKSIERNRRNQPAAFYSAPLDRPRPPSELFRNIAGISNATASNQLQFMERSYAEVAASIREATKASDGSINSLRAQRSAWEALRNTLGQDKAALREVSKELAIIDRQLEKRGVGSGGGRIGKGVQAFGAIASGAIFGGPEGALGGLAGAAIGGVPGAFAGAAIGGTVSTARQQIGQLATYAADISKLEIALKGVTKTQEEYQRALAASASVTKDFNVPQLEATRGMTQLSAAVIGAGGKVADAEVVFRNVTAAIKASGGTSEDVQGALTALGQIFSKGKVSAEELQGQLGERLPGAVTMFAKATGRTLPQLQKDLEQGAVGLADLMKFVVSDQGLGQFEQRAKSVADSSAEAGARLTTTWNDTKRAIGEALMPLGAEIQDSLAKALRDATPALVGFAKGFASLVQLFADNAGLISGVLKTLLGFGAIAGAAIGVTQLAGAMRGLALGIQGLGGAMVTARLAAQSLSISIAAIPGIGWVAAGITALGLLTVELYNNNDAFRTWVNNLGTVISSDFKNVWDGAVSIVSRATDAIVDVWNGASNLISSIGQGIANQFDNLFGGLFSKIQSFWNGLPEPVRRAMSQSASNAVGGLLAPGNPALAYGIGAGVRAAQMGPNAQDSAMFGRYGTADGQTSPAASALTDWQIQQDQKDAKAKQAADKARAEAERLAAEQQRLDKAVAKAEIQLAQTVFNNQMELVKKRYDYEQERIQMQRDIWAGTFEGVKNESARAFVELQNRLGELRKRLFESDLDIKRAQQELTSATRMEAVTSQGIAGSGGGVATTGIIARTGNTGQSTGAHLDLRWGDGRPITRADADKYFLINGKAPSSFGVTSGYGPRSLFGRSFHAGIDFGTPAGSGISLKGGAKFGRDLGNTGAGGYAIEVMTPEGTMRALHLMAGSVMRATPGAPAGAGAQVRRDVRAEGGVGIASAGLGQARAIAGLDKAQVQGLEMLIPQQYAQQQTQGLRDQAKALEDTNALFAKRIQLEAQGMRPELLDAQMRINEVDQERSDKLAQLNENLRIAKDLQNPTLIASVRDEIELTNAAYERQITAINALAQAQTAAGVALSGRIGQLRQELEQLTNFENVIISVSQLMETEISGAIGSAVTGLVTGSQTIKQTLSQMFSNIGQAFVQMAAEIISKQLVMITLQTILKALGAVAGGGGGLEPNTAAGNAGFMDRVFSTDLAGSAYPFAKGGVMTSRGPVPLKKYARGGIANRPQLALYGEGSKPEAYVPLPDGRRIPVALQGQDKMREAMGAGPTQGGGSPVLNMSFQSTSIGGVEYVSRDQLEAAMAQTRRQASRDGAKRGMSMTLDKLQQSPSIRSRVGLR